MSLSLKKMGRSLHLTGNNKENAMVTEHKRVEYYSESKEQWVAVEQLHHDHLINLIIKLVSKDYDGRFRVITKTTETIEQEDEYVITSFIQ